MLNLRLQYFTLWRWEEPTHWKRPWFWERLKVGGEGDDRGRYGWMASPTRWTRVWASSRSWWWTGKPGMLQSKGSQRVRHDWATELIDSFKPTFFSLSSISFKRLFSFSSLSAIRVVSSAYLRLLIFLLANLITTCEYSPAFPMMYSVYMLNKQGVVYSLDVLLSQFWTSPLFHVQY